MKVRVESGEHTHRAAARTGRPQGIAPTMDVFRFVVVKRLCEPFCPPHRPITQICTLKLVPMGEHKASPLPCYGFASRCVHGGNRIRAQGFTGGQTPPV